MSDTLQIDHYELWYRCHDLDCQESRQELVRKYVRIVKYVAGRMAIGLPQCVEFNDLISAGLLGLIQAIDNFDHKRGIKFETYAIPRIRGAILDELRCQDWFPRSLRRKAKQIEEVYGKLEARLGRPATDQELAKGLGIEVAELDGLMAEVSIATIMSLDAEASPEEHDQSANLGEFLADPRVEDMESTLADREMRELIAARMAELPDKEQLVLVLYYYEELTLKEIGEILEVTESRVCQIHTKAIMRLRGKIERHEGQRSIGRLTSAIQRQRMRGAREVDRLAEEGVLLQAVDLNACLALAPVAAALLAGLVGLYAA